MIFLFLTPAVLAYAIIFLYPTLQTIYFSFSEVSSFTADDIRFIGLQNYTRLFATKPFLLSYSNVFKVWLIGGAVIFGLAFLFTILLTSGIRGKSFFRAVIYLPNIINVVALATLWTQYIYQPRWGFFKTFFESLGLPNAAKFQWTSLDNLFWAMLIAYIWGAVGWFMLIVLAGVERIPVDYYEAAKLDGANLFQMFFLITLPLLRDVVRVALVMWSITAFNLFAFPRTFTPVAQPPETYTPAIYLYDLAFGGGTSSRATSLGEAAAAGVSLLLLVVLVYLVMSRLIREERLEY